MSTVEVTYKSRFGSHISQKDVQIAGKFLDERFPDGALPEDVVAAAKPKRSPIHKHFEWDDTEAARLHRLQQARELVGCIIRVEELPDGEQRETRAYHSVVISDPETDVRKRAYVPSKVVFETPDYAAQVIEAQRKRVYAA